MRDIKVVFTGQKRTASGTERTSFSAVPSKCTVTRAVCSAELQHQASSAALEFPYDPDLFKFLFTGGSGDPAAPGELSANITDGGKYVFTGRPSGKFAWNDLGTPCPAEKLSLSLADDTDRLNVTAPKEMGWINEKIILILRDLARLAKVSFPIKDPFTDPGQGYATLVIDEGKSIKSVLDAFLLQHGYSYYFDEMNDLRLFAIPGASAPPVAATLGEHDIVGSPSISQQDRDYTGVKVTYSTLTKKANEQVYFSGSGYKSDNTTAPAVVQQGVYYPFESAPAVEADEGQVYQTFETGYAETYRKYNGELDYRRSARARLLYTENHRVMPEWDGDIEVERTEFGFRRASVRLVNNGVEDASVYCIAIRADAWYADTECSVTAGADGTPYTMECEHIHGASAAERLAKMLVKYFVTPCYKMTAQSEKELAVGSVVTFSTGLSGFTKDALVAAAQYDYDKELWTYTLVGYGGAAQLDIRRVKSQSSNVPALSEIAAVKQQVSKLPGADTTPPSVPVLVSLSGDDYGNALLVFSPSADTGSGMSHYNVYRRRDGASATLQVAGTVSHDPAATQFLWEDVTAYKNTKYAYRVTAVDKAGNESAPSALAEFTSTVRIAPRPPEEPSAAASQYGIRVTWKPFQSSDAALRAAYHEAELSRDGGGTWAAIGRSSERLDYWFDRETDGYPEKPDLAAWRIRVRAVSAYGNTSEYAGCAVGTDDYLTWKIGALTATARAAEKVVTVAWAADGTFYGTPRFDLYKGADKLLGGVTAQTFRDYLAGYPEKDDLAGISYRLVARTEADEAELAGIAVDTSGYLTYKVTPPQAAVRADETGLHISWTGKTEPYYLYPVYDVLVAGKKAAEGITALSLDVPFPEDDRYPLRDDVAATGVVVAARTEADTAQSGTAFPDMSAFKGWVPPVPTLYGTASGRTVPLSWNAPDVWGWTGCDVQVAKAYKVIGGKYEAVTDESELEWYAPALGKNPYESLDNYRHGDAGGWLSVDGTSVALTVPLWGQQKDESGNIMGAADTLYAYRVRGTTVAHKSEWTEPFFAEARATSASDVVRAWNLTDTGEKVRLDGALGARQIFVEELAALSANLGLITDGGLFGGQYNYWAVNDTPMPDGSVLWKGSFRVGDEDQYIKATPVLDGDGNPTGRIDLEFRAGQFTINATGTRIDGKSFEVYDDKGGLMFSVSPEGTKSVIARKEYLPNRLSAVNLDESNSYAYNCFYAFDPFERGGAKCAVAFVTEYDPASETGDTYIQLMTPAGIMRISLDFELENTFFIGDYFFYESATYAEGDNVRTAFLDINLAAGTATPSAFSLLVNEKHNAGEFLDIGSGEIEKYQGQLISGKGGMVYAAGKYFTAAYIDDFNIGIYSADNFIGFFPWTQVLPLDKQDGSNFSIFSLGGRVVVCQHNYSGNCVLHLSDDGVAWTMRIAAPFDDPTRMWLLNGIYFVLSGNELLYSFDLLSWTQCDLTIGYLSISLAFDGKRLLAINNSYSSKLYAAPAAEPSEFKPVNIPNKVEGATVYVADGKTIIVHRKGIDYAEAGSDLSSESAWTRIVWDSMTTVYEGVVHEGVLYAYAVNGSKYYLIGVSLSTMDVVISNLNSEYVGRLESSNGLFFTGNYWGATPSLMTAFKNFVFSVKIFVPYKSLIPVFEGGANIAYIAIYEGYIKVLDENFAPRNTLKFGKLLKPVACEHKDGRIYMLLFQKYLVLVRISLPDFMAEGCVIDATIDDEAYSANFTESIFLYPMEGRIVLCALPLIYDTEDSSGHHAVGHLVVSETDSAWISIGSDGEFEVMPTFISAKLYLTDDVFNNDRRTLGLKCDADGAVVASEIYGVASDNFPMSCKSRISLRRFDFGKVGAPLSPHIEAVRDGIMRTDSNEYAAMLYNNAVLGNLSKFVSDGESFMAYGYIHDLSAIGTDYVCPTETARLFWLEAIEKDLPPEAHDAGVGFTEVIKNAVTGGYRLCVSDPELFGGKKMFIEFNADGTLATQIGPQGAPGRDGRDGRDGKDGADGKDGVSVVSVEQTESSTESGGVNTVTVTLSDGRKFPFEVRNGSKGDKGDTGALTVGDAAEADIADADYAVGAKADGAVTKTPWSKVWAWVKGKIEAVSMTFRVIRLVFDTVQEQDGVQTLMGGIMATNDAWRVAAGGTNDNGYLEIATDDNGTEEIRFAQYSGGGPGTFTNKVREAKILDAAGNTVLPGTLFAGGCQQARLFVIDTSSLTASNFYPVTFPSSDLMLDCEIHSRNLGGGDPYNQNVLHFQLISQGWSDTPFSLNVLQYGVYQESEICIGAVGIGQHSGVNAVWVRGGNQYRFVCNRTPTLRAGNYTEGDETFTVGTFVDGTGLHANVSIVFDPRHVPSSDAYEVTGGAHAYFSGPVGILPYKAAGDGNAVLFGRGKPPRKMVDMDDAAYDELVSGAYIATGSNDESGGIIVSGDGVDIWAPPDRELARFWDEDDYDVVAAVSGDGEMKAVATTARMKQVMQFFSWDALDRYIMRMKQQLTSNSFPVVPDIVGRNGFSGYAGIDVCCFVSSPSGGPSNAYSKWFVDTKMVTTSNGDGYWGVQIAWAVTSSTGRTSFKRCYQDGWEDWSSNDL